MTKDIVQSLKEATKDMLSDESLNEIQSSFDSAVNEKAKIHVEKALNDQDADYSGKLVKLIEAIDADHVSKLNRVVDAIDKNHLAKLKTVIMHYESRINTDASAFKQSVVGNLSRYLEVYLDEKVPADTLKEAVENRRSDMVLSDIRKTLAVDYAMASESIREAVMDGKRIIEDLKKKNAALIKANTTLSEDVETSSTDLLVEKNITDLSDEKKSYMRKMLAGKSNQYINENSTYILNLFDKNEAATLEMLKEEAVRHTSSADAEVPIVENAPATSNSNSPVFGSYLSELSKY